MVNLFLAHGAGLWNSNIWYALPAIIAVSLVYAATRHERIGPILAHAGRVALWLVGFMFVVFAVLEVVGWFT
jgi:hypothetical protein